MRLTTPPIVMHAVWLASNITLLILWLWYYGSPTQEPMGYVAYFVGVLLLNAPISLLGFVLVSEGILPLLENGATTSGPLQAILITVVSMILGWLQWFKFIPWAYQGFVKPKT